MRAKEMFENLGFEYQEDSYIIEYSRFIVMGNLYVAFDKKYKQCTVNIDNVRPFEVDIDLLKAIYKQCEELGWL